MRAVLLSRTAASAQVQYWHLPPISGPLRFQMQLTDEGKTAVVEMIFSDPLTFQAVMQDEATTTPRILPRPIGVIRLSPQAPVARCPRNAARRGEFF